MEERSNQAFVQQARDRVDLVAAALTIVFLTLSTQGHLCGLDQQFFTTDETLALLNFQRSERLTVHGWGIGLETLNPAEPGPRTLSVADVRAELAHPIVHALVDAVAPPRSTLPRTFRESLQQACVRLGQAIHAATYTDQILGVITCIELLFSNTDHMSTFDQKVRRMEALLGRALTTKYSLPDILQARHLYVHQGHPVRERTLPLQAIGLATTALCQFATLAQLFGSKASLLSYLDTLALVERVDDPWAQQILVPLGIQRNTLPNPAAFPIWEHIDYAVEYDEGWNQGWEDRQDRVFSSASDQQDELLNGDSSSSLRMEGRIMSGLTPTQQDILVKFADLMRDRPQDPEWKGIAVMQTDQGVVVRGGWPGERPEQDDIDALVREGLLRERSRDVDTVYMNTTPAGNELAQEIREKTL